MVVAMENAKTSIIASMPSIHLPTLWHNVKHMLFYSYPSISALGIMAYCDKSFHKSWVCWTLNVLIFVLSWERKMYLQNVDCPLCENSCNTLSPHVTATITDPMCLYSQFVMQCEVK